MLAERRAAALAKAPEKKAAEKKAKEEVGASGGGPAARGGHRQACRSEGRQGEVDSTRRSVGSVHCVRQRPVCLLENIVSCAATPLLCVATTVARHRAAVCWTPPRNRLEVFWPTEWALFAGTLVSIETVRLRGLDEGDFWVQYDDGDGRWEDLGAADVPYRWLGAQVAASSGSIPSPVHSHLETSTHVAGCCANVGLAATPIKTAHQ